jgi:hypothetical protein
MRRMPGTRAGLDEELNVEMFRLIEHARIVDMRMEVVRGSSQQAQQVFSRRSFTAFGLAVVDPWGVLQ